MPQLSIMSLVGSAVPEALRARGALACWFIVVDGVQMSGPFASREDADRCKAAWASQLSEFEPGNYSMTM
ncbi:MULTISPECIES: hypothetical protein [Pseudomonas]|uniref:Filamentous hemagglutinin n=1 Tax=Pseudomonas marincola TaxID=437900 RepID=A0A653EAT9_9PSED|nr:MULTISPECIES: hypothetical protein [Pseudomonas]MBQ56534.1 hypothetical protein [Pseudomonadaceae bacterium]NRH29112.1 hypothetical protein [Pseudomonas sp. MS19]CAE6924094.1 conserved protein of unknown function [Pseudomonas marincola]HCP55499.1 hypothetical protein [Pseudomonas sp.]